MKTLSPLSVDPTFALAFHRCPGHSFTAATA